MRIGLIFTLLLLAAPQGAAQAAGGSAVELAQAKKKKKKRKKKKRKKKKKKAAASKAKAEEAKPEPAEATEAPAAKPAEKKAPVEKKAAAPAVAPAAEEAPKKNWWASRSDLGQKMMLGGAGGIVGGLGLSVLGANMANSAVAEREQLFDKQDLTPDERSKIGSLENTTNTMTVVHYLGFGVAGASLIAAAVGGFI